MGHRTLIAYERDGYDLHYAHWGVDPGELTPEEPFGGPPDDGWARERAEELLTVENGRFTDEDGTAVDTDPVATGLSFVELEAYIDPIEHEALYVVDSDFSVRTYLVFALDSRRFGRADGPAVALVGYDGGRDAAYLRGWLAGGRAVRGVCGPGDGVVIKALRWLDPARGTIVWIAGGRPVDPAGEGTGA
ncbi:DUF6735 family protein [Natronomonas sp. LN261]|jgi:hypothetical protein|uniref:DUF6735 family protein n=1 Tax=Natronomonas sp. LN261 TaxID=2750669 RepID=UPI0015EF85E6|nr:DUF6735 family protein [Natronomonas sp. LN261]